MPSSSRPRLLRPQGAPIGAPAPCRLSVCGSAGVGGAFLRGARGGARALRGVLWLRGVRVQ
eukprot:616391-Alexandrium_andersonii.AAC.1